MNKYTHGMANIPMLVQQRLLRLVVCLRRRKEIFISLMKS